MENYNANVKIGDIICYTYNGGTLFNFIEVVEKNGKSVIYGKDISAMVDISYGSDFDGLDNKDIITIKFRPIKGRYKNNFPAKYRIVRNIYDNNKKGIKVKIFDNVYGKFHNYSDDNYAYITMSAKIFFESVKEIGITKEDVGKTIIL